MMMGGMNSGGSMGMDMMGMGGMSNMGMGGNMSAMGSMNMGNMQGMAGMQMYPNGMAGMNHGAMQGMNDPSMVAGMNHGNAMGTGGLFGGGAFDLNSLLGGLLNLAIDIFAILLVVGLIVGAAVLLKRYLFENELFTPKAKVACTNCGQTLNAEWACCPKCGQAKVVPQPVANANPQTV